jgi:hypothetical protein
VLERELADAVQARLGQDFRIVALQIAAAQLTAVDAWMTGSISATPQQMAARIIATARLSQ